MATARAADPSLPNSALEGQHPTASSAEVSTPVGLTLTLPDRLAALAAVAGRLGARRLEADARALVERATADRFYVAVVGQFKRGKSTLINALLGEAVLPTGILPVTAVPVVLRHGTGRLALVRTADGTREIELEELATFISEECNRENRLGVESVEVLVPSPSLANGLCLVDTPGLGSAFPRTTEAARAFLPHIDALIVVIGCDPPLTGDEVAASEAVARHSRQLLVVLNKADRATPEELTAARAFAERMLSERLGRAAGPVLEVSAVEVLQSGPTRDWHCLPEWLSSLQTRAGRGLAHSGAQRGADLLFDRCLRELDLARDLAMRPVSETEARLETLANLAGEIALDSLRLRGELERRAHTAVHALADQRASFLATALPRATGELRDRLRRVGRRGPTSARRHALAIAREIASEAVSRWLREAQPSLLGTIAAARDDFDHAARESVARLGALAGPVTIALPAANWPYEPDERDAPVGGGRLLDDLAPWRWTRRSILRSAEAELERCLVTAAARAHGALALAVHELRLEAERQVETAVQDFIDSIDRARGQVRQMRERDRVAERERLDQLMAMRREVLSLRDGRSARLSEPPGQ